MGNYEHVATIVWDIATVVPLNIKESMHSNIQYAFNWALKGNLE